MLLRVGFFVFIVILMLPAEPEMSGDSKASQRPVVQGKAPSAVELVGAARGAVHDISGICNRSPQVCETGSAFASILKRKARYGANMIYAMFLQDEETSPELDAGSLKPFDREPAWSSSSNSVSSKDRDYASANRQDN